MNSNQANIVRRTLTSIITKNQITSDGITKNYRDQFPPNIAYEQSERFATNEALTLVLDALPGLIKD